MCVCERDSRIRNPERWGNLRLLEQIVESLPSDVALHLLKCRLPTNDDLLNPLKYPTPLRQETRRTCINESTSIISRCNIPTFSLPWNLNLSTHLS